MSSLISPLAWEKEHFWLYLLALGFDPVVNTAAGKISAHLRFGVNMFDKPNKDAFHIIAWFLFSKLDKSYCNEIFRFCYPPTDKKADSEFRKQCYEWLRRISDECGNSFPAVVASLFLSPGGPKFIHLMFHFARYVIMHHIKVDSAGAGIPYPEAVNLRSPDLNMAVAKYRVALYRFLQNLKKEDLMIQELQKKALLLTKQIRDLRYENVDLDKQLQKMGKKVDHSQSNSTERIEKVRYLWTTVMETLTFLQKEKEVVDSVIKGHVDQYILDGTSISVSIPWPLLQKVEKEMHKFPVGNVYEMGKLNVLTVIQLLTKALEILMYEWKHVDKKAFKLDLQYLEGKAKFQNEALLRLKSLRQKLKCENHVSVIQSIAEKQQEWNLKWENCLGQSPFHLIKDPNPALDLLPAMSPLSFTPATEEVYKSSVFCQYPALISDLTKNNFQTKEIEIAGKTPENEACSTMAATERTIMTPLNLAIDSEKRMPSEKTSNVETPKMTDNSNFGILKYKGRNPKLAESEKKRHDNMIRRPSSAKEEDPLKKAQEHLAEEVADIVISDSSQHSEGKGRDLGDLIDTLISNPFLTRKQIPRTPENLITEIRSSWQKAIQTEEPLSVQLRHTEAAEQLSQDAVPTFRDRTESSMTCFMSSCMSDTAESPFLDVQSPCSFHPVVTNELLTHQTDHNSPDHMICKKELSSPIPDKMENPELVFKALNKNVSEMGCGSDNNIVSEPLSPNVGQNSSMCTTLAWDTSQTVGGICSEVIQLGILQETLPEEAGSISLNSVHDLELDESREENSRDGKPMADYLSGNERKLDFQSILSRYEALKRTVLETPLSSEKRMPRSRSEFSLTPVSPEMKGLSPLGKPYASDAELVKTSSHLSHLERKVPLSPLVAFSPVQLGARVDVRDRGDLFNKLKEK